MDTMRRVSELDGLRGLAALAVVVYHFASHVFPWGNLGVNLFFVLSGYLITAIVLEDGASPGFLPKFYARRSLRIWPPYYLTIALLVVFGLGPATGLGYYLSYTQGAPLYFGARVRLPVLVPDWPQFNHSWTLAVEEQFYLVWPALLLAVGGRRVPALALGCIAASATLRGYRLSPILLPGCMDGLAAGGLLAARRRAGRPDRAGLSLLAAAVAYIAGLAASGVAAPVLRLNPAVMRATWGLTWSFAFYAVVAWVSANAATWRTAPLRFGPLVWLGTVSYGVYLYHIPIAAVWLIARGRLVELTGAGWLTRLPLGVVAIPLTLAAAALSWRFLERPALRLKRHFEYDARGAVPTPHLPPTPAHGRTDDACAVGVRPAVSP